MAEHIWYGIEYNKPGWMKIGGMWTRVYIEKALYSSTSSASLFDTRGKANARLKTHFKDGKDERQARVIKFELKEVEEC